MHLHRGLVQQCRSRFILCQCSNSSILYKSSKFLPELRSVAPLGISEVVVHLYARKKYRIIWQAGRKAAVASVFSALEESTETTVLNNNSYSLSVCSSQSPVGLGQCCKRFLISGAPLLRNQR